LDIIRWTLPDVTVLSSTLVIYICLRKLQAPFPGTTKPHASSAKQTRRLSSLYYHVGPYLNLALLCLTSALEPSLISAIYYTLFLLGSTAWALDLRAKCITITIFLFAVITSSVHLVGLYLFQVQVLRDLLLSVVPPSLEFWIRQVTSLV
jgi:hypothetical protein